MAEYLTAGLAVVALSFAGCAPQSANSGLAAENGQELSAQTFFTTDVVHDINVEMDLDDYEEMLDIFRSTDEKEWIKVSVSIDGNTFDDVGLRLKGNSSLRTALSGAQGFGREVGIAGVEEDIDTDQDPAELPWLIRLDKYVEGQDYLGRVDFVVRGNDTESSLNEALAVSMLEEAGLATHRVAFTSFSVNSKGTTLRLVSEVPDDELWNADWFEDGSTWKADSEGDWDYHGEDESEYVDIWKQRTGEDDMTPVIEFLDFVNNASDEEFEAGLDQWLDVNAFARYLAVEDLVNNWDTISGMGNNGYLHYDPKTGLMTVVAWDHDRAFQSFGGGGAPGAMPSFGESGEAMPMPSDEDGRRPQMEQGQQSGEAGARGPNDFSFPGSGGSGDWPQSGQPMEPPSDGNFPIEGDEQWDREGGRGEGMGGRQVGAPGMGTSTNILESRFLASDEFKELYDKVYTELQNSLINSGFAETVLNRLSDLLISDASSLISNEAVESDRAAIESQLVDDES